MNTKKKSPTFFESNSFDRLHAMSVEQLETSINRCKKKLEGDELTFLFRTTIQCALTQYYQELTRKVEDFDVLQLTCDEMVCYSCDAGDSSREMADALKRIVPASLLPTAIQNIAKALNHIVFGTHESESHNRKGEENLMRELATLEKDIAKFINNGFVQSYEQIMNYLRKEWCNKWQSKVLSR